MIQIVLLVLVAIAAGYDLRFRRIPNWLCAAGVIAGFTLNGSSAGLSGLRTAALGFGLALLIYVPLFILRAMGGGDVKLMAAVGAMTGPSHWLAIFLITAITGGLVAVLLLIWKGGLGRALRNTGFILWELAHLRKPYTSRQELDIGHPEAISLPHGAVIALGCGLFLLTLR
jgi:prepilin peptidase CpaA